jgi:hypothetical protein
MVEDISDTLKATIELVSSHAEPVLTRKHPTYNVAMVDMNSCRSSIAVRHGQVLSSEHRDTETKAHQEALHATCNEALTTPSIRHEHISVPKQYGGL